MNMESDGIVSLIKKLMQNMCLSEAQCTIYSLLACSEKPMNVKELSEKTGYSPAMVYSSMRELIKNNLVDRIKEESNIAYIANINFIDVFEKRRKKIMEDFLEPLTNLDLDKYSNNVRIKEIKDYAKNIQTYFRKINSLKNGEMLVKK
jgi:DNA-binding transcriptional regulator GbsR (MarR family)